jgi:AraC family transcriptional regulator
MKVIVFVKATPDSEAGVMPETELLAAMGQYNDELVKAGIMLAGEGLKPSSCGARVTFSGSNRTVMDGPFAETKELVAGFWIWNVRSMQEAIDWARKCPNPMPGESVLEIRPVFEADDFGVAFTPELREQEAELRAVEFGLNRPTFTQGPAMTIAGVNRTYTMETRVGIPQHWEVFVPQIGSVRASHSEICFGVCWNTTPDCGFDYLTGVEVTDPHKLPVGMTSVKIDARRYAVFTHTGHVSALPKTIDTIWTRWVPECGLKIANAPCFERYTSEFNGDTGMGGMEIWVPLES